MTGDLALYLIPLGVGVAGFLLGRLTASHAARARELETQLESARKEGERARSELEAVLASQEQYRGEVADHFVGTADRLRDLALQYRAVYDHLALGARDLCPERFEAIESPMETDLLTSVSSSSHEEEEEEPPRQDEVA